MLRTGKAGQLKKGHNGHVGHLRDRWFVSEGFHVQYFESSTSQKRCGRFDLRNIKLVRPVADAREAVEFLVVEGRTSKSIAIAFGGVSAAERDEWLSLWTSALEAHNVHPSLVKYRSLSLADQFNNDHHDAPVLISTVRHSQKTILTPRVPAASGGAAAAARETPLGAPFDAVGSKPAQRKGLEMPPDEFMADSGPITAAVKPVAASTSNEIEEGREANIRAKEEVRKQREREIDAKREANIRAKEQKHLQKEIERTKGVVQTVEPPVPRLEGPPPDAGGEGYAPVTEEVASAAPAQVRLQRAASAEEPVELELTAYVPPTSSADLQHGGMDEPVHYVVEAGAAPAAAGEDEDEDEEALVRRVAWIKYHVKQGEVERAFELGWNGDMSLLDGEADVAPAADETGEAKTVVASEVVPTEAQAKDASGCRLVHHAISSASLEEEEEGKEVPLEEPEPFEVEVTLDTSAEPAADEPRPEVEVTLMESPETIDGGVDDAGNADGGTDFGDQGGEAYEDSDIDDEEDEDVPEQPSRAGVASMQASGEREDQGVASAETASAAPVPTGPPAAAPAPPPSGGFQAMKALQLAELEAQLGDEARFRQRARKEAAARARSQQEARSHEGGL